VTPDSTAAPVGTPAIVLFSTKGSGSNEEARIQNLLAPLAPRTAPFARGRKLRSARRIVLELARDRPDLVVMEGTGLAGGAAILLARLALGIPYVVSSGDAVGPFLAMHHPLLRPVVALYERILYRHSAGVIGWTPYLVGRALTLGAPRAVTAAGWSLTDAPEGAREARRTALGIPAGATVFGLAGALVWTARRQYCYGLELVRAAHSPASGDTCVLIVGDGTGMQRLRDEAGDLVGRRVFFTGQVPYQDVPAWLAAMDVASLPQSTDQVGSFRYTTKLPEYLAAGLPVVMSRIPAAYDLDDGWLWRLPGDGPWDRRFVASLAELMGTVTRADVARRRAAASAAHALFAPARQQRIVSDWSRELLEELRAAL
jgi:hypothetical protein